MEFDRGTRSASMRRPAAHDAPVPGKQTLTQGMVQMHPAAVPSAEPATEPLPAPASPRPTLQRLFGQRGPASDPEQVHAAATRGTATAATQLPHLEQIQRSFGKHDISAVQAHVGGEAAASARDMGAAAYATGNHVVLGTGTDLHTVAHEAAHVVQQRGGVQLKGGVGEVGDAYEQHADQVADLVVQGKSAEALLGPAPAPGVAAAGVQRKIVKANNAPYADFDEVDRAIAASNIALTVEQKDALRDLEADDQLHPFNDALAQVRGQLPGSADVADAQLDPYLTAHPTLRQQMQYPHALHFIWSGRAISSAALANIKLWGKLASKSKWTVNIWTDKTKREWSLGVKAGLSWAGIKLHDIDDKVVDARLWPHYQKLMSAEKPNYPAASDLARYSILQAQGGIYIDVDIAPGDVQLTQGASSLPTPLPQLAPEIRDARAVRDEMGLNPGEQIEPEHVNVAATRRMLKGQFNNNFLVSGNDSRAMEAVIAYVHRQLENGGIDNLMDSHDLAATMTGPNAVTRALMGHIQSIAPQLSTAQVLEVFKQSVTPALNPAWLTPESESQEH